MVMRRKGSSQIGMTGKEDSVHVPDLALVPVGTVKQATGRGHRADFIRVCFDSDAGLMCDREEVVDDLLSVLMDLQHDKRSDVELTSNR